jgi:hypothetical protein
VGPRKHIEDLRRIATRPKHSPGRNLVQLQLTRQQSFYFVRRSLGRPVSAVIGNSAIRRRAFRELLSIRDNKPMFGFVIGLSILTGAACHSRDYVGKRSVAKVLAQIAEGKNTYNFDSLPGVCQHEQETDR